MLLTLVAFGLLTAYAGRLAWRAHMNIVSLDVHNLPVREVAKKLRWQTWENILVHNDVDARITIHVEDQPLNGVLSLIAEQCGNANWSIAYPLYTTKDKLNKARQLAVGDAQDPQPGWTNWNQRPNFAAMFARLANGDTNAQRGMGGFGGPGGFFGGAQAFTPVTTNFDGQTPMEAAFALRQFGRVKVVPEDGTARPVILSMSQLVMDRAVSHFAKWESRKWAKFYLLEPRGNGFRPNPQEMAQRPQMDPEQMQQMRQRFEEDPNRQARATQRFLDNIKNTTAEQRAEQRSRRGGPGGFGGPGGGGPGGGGRGGR